MAVRQERAVGAIFFALVTCELKIGAVACFDAVGPHKVVCYDASVYFVIGFVLDGEAYGVRDDVQLTVVYILRRSNVRN